MAEDYTELHARVKAAGLLEKQPGYEAIKIITSLSLLGLFSLLIIAFPTPFIAIPVAIFGAFATVQVGFLLHDSGHRQPFKQAWINDLVGLVAGNLLIGISYRNWVDYHNKHHANPNHVDMDPDINIPLLAYHRGKLKGKKGVGKWIVKNQAYLFFPLLFLQAFSTRVQNVKYAIRHAVRQDIKYARLELLLLALNYVLYFGLLFVFLPAWLAITVFIIHHAFTGLYMSSVFAPNHKGMPEIHPGHELDFVREQVITARNVKANPVVDYIYGGLNYQIEHHLFPMMARNNLPATKKIVMEFCKEKGIPYYETGVVRSYVEILQHLHHVSAPLRHKSGA